MWQSGEESGTKTVVTRSPAETEAAGETLARTLCPGGVVALFGPLGAGKTQFVRGLARGLGDAGPVSSPTFALVHEYAGACPLYHFDMYRVESWDDLESTGFFDYLEAGGVVAVEWSEHIEAALPPEALRVEIVPVGENERRITVWKGART